MAGEPLFHVLKEILGDLDVLRAPVVVARSARGEHAHAVEGLLVSLGRYGQHRHHGHLLAATPVAFRRVLDENGPLMVNRSHHVVESTATDANIEPIVVVPMRRQ